MSRGCKDGRKRREVCLWMGVGDIERVQMNQGKERVEKLLLAPLFLHPNNVPFLLVVWKTLTPPPPFLLSFPYLSAPICFTVPCTWTNGLAPARASPNDPHLREPWG